MSKSQQLFQQARQHIPGGVNSPVRAFQGVGGTPVFFTRGEGAYLFDADGRRYVDYVGSWGPMIAGHCHPAVVKAVQDSAANGLGFGAPTEIETRMADLLCELVPSLELVRMVSSGTEATMSAIRLARGFTGRDKIVKFEGCYHGHSDSLLVKAGSGALTLGVPTSPGVPASMAEHTITLSFNDLDQVRSVFAELGEQIACIIVEPVAGNMNMVPPVDGFLEGLRSVCDQHGALLVFDEIQAGYGRTGTLFACEQYDVVPDILLLANHFAARMAYELEWSEIPEFSPAAVEALQNHNWPGNVRELKNVIERAVILSKGKVARLDLAMADILAAEEKREPAPVPAQPQRIYTEAERLDQDRHNMLRALEAANWRVSGPQGAAALLGIRPSTFSDRMKKFEISRPH